MLGCRSGGSVETYHGAPPTLLSVVRASLEWERRTDPEVVEMDSMRQGAVVAEVAACAQQAAHRRDHHHGVRDGSCRPHVVEVVHLGDRALMICHDCGQDSGFVPERVAVQLAEGHRLETAA